MTAALSEGKIPSAYWRSCGSPYFCVYANVIFWVCNQYFPIVLYADIPPLALCYNVIILVVTLYGIALYLAPWTCTCVVVFKSIVSLSDYTALGVVGAKDLSCSPPNCPYSLIHWPHAKEKHTGLSRGISHFQIWV